MTGAPTLLDLACEEIVTQGNAAGIDGAVLAAEIRAKVECGDLVVKQYESGQLALQITEQGRQKRMEGSDGD